MELVSFTEFKGHKLKPEWPWSFFWVRQTGIWIVPLSLTRYASLRELLSLSFDFFLCKISLFHRVVMRIKWTCVKCLVHFFTLFFVSFNFSYFPSLCLLVLQSESLLQLCLPVQKLSFQLCSNLLFNLHIEFLFWWYYF